MLYQCYISVIMGLNYEHFVFIGSFFKFLICLVVVTILTIDQKKHALMLSVNGFN